MNSYHEARKIRWDELCDKIEALIREYGEIIMDPNDLCDEHGEPVEEWQQPDYMPDFSNPLSILDWELVFAIEDTAEDSTRRGYWTLHVEPFFQVPYRTRGLLESRLDQL